MRDPEIKKKLSNVFQDYPTAFQIFAGQFHEDQEGETEEILNREVFREYDTSELQQAIQEMTLLQENFPEENDLGYAVSGLGARMINLNGEPINYTDWINALKELFHAEIKRREKEGITKYPY